MKAAGCAAPPELIAAASADPGSPAFAGAGGSGTGPADIEVWPDMADAVALFLALATQWRWVGVGMAGAMRTGLDYAPIAAIAGMLGIEVTPRVLADLRIMEGAAVEQWGRK